MIRLGLLVRLRAKAGKEAEVEKFLADGLQLARGEPGTRTWYSFRMSPTEFGIFDTFDSEEGRAAHLSGDIAKALMFRADELLAEPPQIETIDILASK
jgi:quinol monooxygenase YgiN